MGRKRKTTEEFIELAKTIHGSKYDYSKTIYVLGDEKVCIICPEHGEFWLTPRNHLHGSGCKKCATEILKDNLTSDNKSFIEKAHLIHNHKYTYEKLLYKNNHTKVIITCPIHGDFEQTPQSHLNGSGCPKCGVIKSHKNITFSTEQFIEKAKLIHKDYYDYSKVNYINKRQKVLIICPIHGEFWLEAGHHMLGHGCPKCNQSKGELLIEKYLSCNNIPYIRLYSVDIDTSINPTGYAYIDFYLPDFNCFIEYNGVLHYIPQEHFGGQIQFNKLKSRDSFIRDYCKNNNINLLEIKYDLSDLEIINTIEKYLINNGYKIVET